MKLTEDGYLFNNLNLEQHVNQNTIFAIMEEK